jgi:uncharacterized protein YjbI with pentapeptide repeats
MHCICFSAMKKCNFSNTNLTSANFIYANLQGSDLTHTKILNTNFVQANLGDIKISNADKSAYLKYAKLEGSGWE